MNNHFPVKTSAASVSELTRHLTADQFQHLSEMQAECSE